MFLFILRKNKSIFHLNYTIFISICLHHDAGFSPKNCLKILQYVMFSISFLIAKPHYLKLHQLHPMKNVGNRRTIQIQN